MLEEFNLEEAALDPILELILPVFEPVLDPVLGVTMNWPVMRVGWTSHLKR